ncbi:hypothetical protein NKI32_05100 [Mesorhizobium sp. M0761]|uniref:hypothetical protein n=1 Tax=Mesorhizobium sp. M0761 TaxID=2956994 RepID=UPI00333673F1
MAVYFFTASAKKLLEDFDSRIAQKEAKGKIETWEKVGDYYTHKADAWAKKAWFKTTVSDDRLKFNIYPSKDQKVSVIAYGYYHGHLIETFLNHFDNSFTSGSATANAKDGDHVG